MKKLCTICLIVCLATASLAAAPVRDEAEEAADGVPQVMDLSGYEDETLVDLLKQVQAEIVARGIEKTAAIRTGTYVFGQDIPVGRYTLKKSQEGQSGKIAFAAADDPENSYPSKMYEFITEEEAFEAYITAEEGDVLTVEFPCDLTISAGVTFQ